LKLNLDVPFISFSFDDFPRSALDNGGEILNSYGLAGTYFASLGLLGLDSPSGQLCTESDLIAALEQGHELGCHTFSHCHSWDTDSQTFERSIIENQAALATIVPGTSFSTFAYPISLPRPSVKRVCGKHFNACRAGGQRFNSGTADINQLSAFFLEKSRDDIESVKGLIDKNRETRGWAIFATHDVSPNPSPYGCSPKFLLEVVEYAVNSGAQILPIGRVLEAIHSTIPHSHLAH
jgi:peptidoglycan/xylan/chitin deacetylase (PgdA/CDA1 family)